MLAPEAIELAVAVEDELETLEKKVREQRVKTRWDRVRNSARSVFVTEERQEPDDKVVVNTSDPNALMDMIPELETLLGEAHLGLSYGGIGIAIRKARSAYLAVKRRNDIKARTANRLRTRPPSSAPGASRRAICWVRSTRSRISRA